MTLLFSIPVLAAWAFLLVCHDVRHSRLPDGLTLPPAASGVLVTCWVSPAGVLPGLGWFLSYLVLAEVTRGGIGGGDVKLAVPLGFLATAIAGTTGGLLAAAVAGILTSVVLTVSRRRSIPHGPAMVVGTLVVVVAAVSGGAGP